MAELFDESHFFMCAGGMKPARIEANQNIACRETGEYYLTEYSLKCKGIDFACKWVALLYAIVAAAMALLCSCPAGWVLLAAILGALAGSIIGAAMCGDLAAIMRVWVVIKTDAEISGYKFVANRPGVHMNCKAFGQPITFVPNVKTEFEACCIFAGNIVTTGLEGFMYVYAFRGAGVLFKAPMAFLRNFGVNYLTSLTVKGLLMRGVFAGYSTLNSYYLSPVEGGDKDKMTEAALDGGFFIERAAWRLIKGVGGGYVDPKDGKFNWKGLLTDTSMLLSMGGIPSGTGGKDATRADVNRAVNQIKHPVKTVKADIKKVVDTAKEFKNKIKESKNGKGAGEKPKVISNKGKTAREHAFEEMQNILDQVQRGKIGKRQIPSSLEVAVNKYTGEIVVGKSGRLNKGNPKPELHKNTLEQFKEGSKEPFNERNCSEADVVDQINRKNQSPNDYEYHAVEIDPVTGKIQDKHTCRNCDVNMKEQIENGDVTSNTPESKARRDKRNQNK